MKISDFSQSFLSAKMLSNGATVEKKPPATLQEVAPTVDGDSFRRTAGRESDPPSSLQMAPVTPEVPDSPYADATVSGTSLLQDVGSQSEAGLFRGLYLDGDASFPEVRLQFRQDLSRGLSSLSEQGKDVSNLLPLLDKLNAASPRRLYNGLLALSLDDPDNAEIRPLKEQAGLWQALEDFPKLKADGLSRTREHYVSSGHLALATAALNWDTDAKTGLSIADSVIVGGGPGGLSTAYHLSEAGCRTVVFEGGKIGQGFSDSGAQSVHQLRTSGDTSNLIYVGSPAQLGIDVSLPRHLAKSREKGNEARSSWNLAVGEKEHGVSSAQGGETKAPANRSELFDHMAQVANGLSEHYPNTFISESSPVTTIEKVERGDQTLFSIKTEKGHQILARSLVMATGFVGSDGEYARCLSDLSSVESAISLCDDNDLISKSQDLLSLQSGLKDGKIAQNLVMSERMLGRPELRNIIKSLPPGSRIGMIGGGESATKGALELLALNEGVTVDIYTSDPLEPYQTQIPTSVIHPNVIEKAITNPQIAARALEESENFETPVTAETMMELLEAESAGRVRIREMGERFSAKSVNISSIQSERGVTLKLDLKSDSAKQSLEAQRQSWVQAGIYGEGGPPDSATELPNIDLFVIAAGYDKRALSAGPLIQQLVDQNLVELDKGNPILGSDGLTSGKNPMLSFNTAGAVSQPADSAIPGRAIKAFRLAKNLVGKLPEREKPTDRIASKLPFGNVDTVTEREEHLVSDDWVNAFLDNEGVTSQQIADKEQEMALTVGLDQHQIAEQEWDIERRFPVANGALRKLLSRALVDPTSLTPAEKVMVQRAQSLSERIYAPR